MVEMVLTITLLAKTGRAFVAWESNIIQAIFLLISSAMKSLLHTIGTGGLTLRKLAKRLQSNERGCQH